MLNFKLIHGHAKSQETTTFAAQNSEVAREDRLDVLDHDELDSVLGGEGGTVIPGVQSASGRVNNLATLDDVIDIIAGPYATIVQHDAHVQEWRSTLIEV